MRENLITGMMERERPYVSFYKDFPTYSELRDLEVGQKKSAQVSIKINGVRIRPIQETDFMMYDCEILRIKMLND